MIVSDDLAEPLGLALWTDRPQYIRQILRPELGWTAESLEFRLDHHCTRLGLHRRATPGVGGQYRSSKIDARGRGTMAIVHRRKGALGNCHAVDGSATAIFPIR